MSTSSKAKEYSLDLSADGIDAAIDLLTQSELLQEIPVAGMLLKIAKAASSIPNIIFLKKVEKFIQTIHDKTTREERIVFSEEIKKDQEKRNSLYSSIFLKIDKFDDFTKPELFAKIFSCYIINKLEENEYAALSSALNLASMQDFYLFCRSYWGSFNSPRKKIFKNSTFDKNNYGSLVTANFVSIRLKTAFSRADILHIPHSELEFEVTELGELFAFISQDLEEYFRPLLKYEKEYASNHGRAYEFGYTVDSEGGEWKRRIYEIHQKFTSVSF